VKYEQTYVIEKQESFNLTHILECGQCFRWEKEEDGSYTGVIKSGVINVKKEGNKIVFSGICQNNLKTVVYNYFDLKTDYRKYKKVLSNIDKHLKQSIEFGEGIRILEQDLWECIISFIISANNNIPRIKKIINRLSMEYGEEILWKGKKYYKFPTLDALSKASVKDLRNLGLGFRDKRVYNTTKMILEKQVDLDGLKNMESSDVIRNELMRLDGVGEKVADCIMLFSLKRVDVFPIDVWVRRVMNDLYIHNKNEEEVNKKELKKLADEKFLGLSGIAQQYLFYWKRTG